MAIVFTILSMEVMSWCLPYSDFVGHVQGIFVGFYLFVFLIVLSATLRLPKPGIGWSVIAYLPLILQGLWVIELATEMARTITIITTMPVLQAIVLILVAVTLILGGRKIPRQDYPAALGSMGVSVVATVLSFMGYYYLSIMLILYAIAVFTCLSAFVCLKMVFRKKIANAGAVMRLTLTHLIYPAVYIFTFYESLFMVANIFNLNSWLSEQLATPFVSLPQFGIISVSRLLWLVCLAIAVNYIVKVVKLILMRVNPGKYETGNMAVAVKISTMAVWVAYVLTALIVLRINHAGIVAAIGGASLGLGFAMKDTFENLFCGLSLMASRARPGDIVECEGERGVIKKIGIISTQVQIEDGPIVLFPNRQLFGRNFTNLTLNDRREIRHIVFDLTDTNDLDKAKRLMLEASVGIDGVVDHDRHYVVMCHTAAGVVRLDYKCWLDSEKYLRAEPAVREAIFNAFRANGIRLASFPEELGMRAANVIMDTTR